MEIVVRRRRARAGTANAPPATNGAALAPVRAEPRATFGALTQGARDPHDRLGRVEAVPEPGRKDRCRGRRFPKGATFPSARRRPCPATRPTSTTTSRPGPTSSTSTTGSTRRRRRRRMRADRRRHDLQRDRGRLGVLPRQRDPDHARPPDRQRSAAALLPPDQHRAGRPQRSRRRTRRWAARCTPPSTAARALRRGLRPRVGAARPALPAAGRRHAGPAGGVAAPRAAPSPPGCRTASIHIRNGGGSAVDVPVTGTTEGTLYGGQKSGWITLAAGAERVLEPADPAKAAAPRCRGPRRSAQTLTATGGTWTGTPEIARALPLAALRRQGRGLRADRGRDRDDLRGDRRGRRIDAPRRRLRRQLDLRGRPVDLTGHRGRAQAPGRPAGGKPDAAAAQAAVAPARARSPARRASGSSSPECA